MYYKLDIDVHQPKAFKTFNAVSSVYVLEANMLMHNVIERNFNINVNGVAVISHGGVTQLCKTWNKYTCGKPGGVGQSMCKQPGAKDIQCQNQPGDVYDDFISVSIIADIEDDDLELTVVYNDFMSARLAGGSIMDVDFTPLGDDRKLSEVVKQGWVVLDRKDLVQKFGRYDTLVGINTGAIQKQYAVDEDGKEIKPLFSVANLGYQIVGRNTDKDCYSHETVLGAVEFMNVHNTERTISECIWKWTNFSNVYVLTQGGN